MRFRLRTALALFPIAAVFLTISAKSGYWCSAGLLVAALALLWALCSRKRGKWLLLRIGSGLGAAAAIWFLALDRSDFVEGCPDCLTGRFITQYRILGFPTSTNIYETRTSIDLALADLGAPCLHEKLYREQTHRMWGLLICRWPCINGTWGLGGDERYTDYVSMKVKDRGKADPNFAADMHRRVIDQDDKKYFWEAFMIDVMAPEGIAAKNTREALAWLEGSTDADYRSLWSDKSTAESLAFVQRAYAAGAEKVFAVEIQPYEWDERRSVSWILLKLPSDPLRRASFFQWLATQYKRPDDIPADFGQSFVSF